METERLVCYNPHPQYHPTLGELGSVRAAAYGRGVRLSRQPVNAGRGEGVR